MSIQQMLPADLVANYDRRLDRARVPPPKHADYHKWVRFYLISCQKYGFPPTAPTALGPFLTKLADRNYSIDQRHHAAAAVRLLLRPDRQDPSLYLQLSAPVLSTPPVGTIGPLPSQVPHPACSSLAAPGRPLGSSGTHRASWEQEYRDLESAIKLRNYSAGTLEAYRFWVARFQAFVRSRPTAQVSNQQVLLSSLAVQQGAEAAQAIPHHS